MGKSCLTCPHAVAAGDLAQQTKIYGKPTGMITCRARGIILGTPAMSNEQTSERMNALGSVCGKHSKNTDEVVIALSIGVGTPNNPVASSGPAKTCKACYFYVPPVAVSEKFTLAMGACAKFGKLVPDQHASTIARNCGESRRAEVTNVAEHRKAMIDSITLDPGLAKYLTPHDMPAGTKLWNKDSVDTSLEPSTYPTDQAVSAKQDAAGIRAWRKLTQGKREVYLPIFKRDIFSPEEQAKIPATGDQEHPEKYIDHMGLTFTVAALWLMLDETPALHGKAGTGKTEFFRYMAWLMQIPFERISITGESEKDDLAGKMFFENNETVFKDGRIVAAWKKPNVVVLDEPNTGPPEVWQFIRPLTDNSKQLVNDANEGETVERNQFCFLGMAMNPAWDHRNVGAQVIGDADGSRLMHIFVDMPPENLEREIIEQRCKLDGYEIEQSMLDTIMSIAKSIREMSDASEVPLTWGIRNQIKVARATAWFPVEKAYSLAVLDYLEPETKATVLEVVRQNTRGKVWM
ncbi:AAA-ATPase [Gordonia phage PokyPuppy]|nr:AAA-ATPase [Gordonia phage PokyPuppy]